ncbi:hypothetical protein C0995_004538 [Termitomyces sp. Mi166|nr:hypothetical protein C0995_004538 [Termitomyces sp. Mi166\
MSSNFNPSKQTFWDFASYLQKLNSLLFNTLLHFKTGGLCTQIEAKLDSLLSVKYFKKSLNTVTDVHKWLNSICQLNKNHCQSEKHQCEITDEVFCQSKKPFLMLNKVNTMGTLAQSSSSTSSLMKQKLPPLTDDKKCLLLENSRCYHCCCPYVTCCTGTCKKGFPDAATYVTLTQATCDAAKAAGTHMSNSTSAATSIAPSLSSPTFTAVLPLASFTSIKEMDNSFANSQASDVSAIPLCVPHCMWSGSLMGPNVDSLITVSMLLDDGSQLMLIDAGLVNCLGLHCCQLAKPLAVNVAFLNNKLNSTSMLSKYCRLAVTSLDQNWTSHTIHAVIAPNLCMPIIHGLLFLTVNNIIVDYAAWTVIDKISNYNLLNPVPPVSVPPQKFVLMQRKFKQTIQHHKKLAKELKFVYAAQLECIEQLGLFKSVAEVNVVAAVHQ